MAFNTALSGLRAANQDLSVTGNNIANASTVGFKEGRAEFADVVATTALGAGGAVAGSGVGVTAISQNFEQGTLSFTDNVLDLAINGNGFFQVSDNKGVAFTRSGQFGLDSEGFIVDNFGANLRGNAANTDGNLIQVPANLQVNADVIPGRSTTRVDQNVNLDSKDDVLVELRDRFIVNAAAAGASLGVTQAGAGNGYAVGAINLNGVEQTNLFSSLVTPNANPAADLQANQVAAALSTLSGVTASASTQVTLSAFDFNAGQTNTLSGLIVNGTPIVASANATELLTNLQNAGFVVSVPAAGSIQLTVTSGADIVINTSGVLGNGGLITTGPSGVGVPQNNTTNTTTTTGGTLTIDTEVNVSLEDAGTAGDTVWGGFNDASFSRQPALQAFDPVDADTYNFATSLTVFDSLGIDHIMTQYFVKEPLDPQDLITGGQSNTWSMYVQIDGDNVGGTNTASPSLARYVLRYNQDGTLAQTEPATIMISNWTPGGSGGVNASEEALNPDPTNPVVEDPQTSSNFEIRMGDATQFAGDYAVNAVTQNGFAQGRLSALNVTSEGNIFARFTNGESQLLGQVLLADFVNTQGLSPLGGSKWAETFASGVPNVGSPQSGLFGSIQSGALEESNTDLSEQLVNLIIAQRNYQASAKTIETANQITQTVINLR